MTIWRGADRHAQHGSVHRELDRDEIEAAAELGCGGEKFVGDDEANGMLSRAERCAVWGDAGVAGVRGFLIFDF